MALPFGARSPQRWKTAGYASQQIVAPNDTGDTRYRDSTFFKAERLPSR